jgi:hypothetical protein
VDCKQADFAEAIVKHSAPIASGEWRGAGADVMRGTPAIRGIRGQTGELQLHGFYGFHGLLLGIDGSMHQG